MLNQVPLNLDLAKEGVDYYMETLQKDGPPGARESSSSAIATSRTSLHNSLSDIYIKAMTEKLEAKKKLKTQVRISLNLLIVIINDFFNVNHSFLR